ncbi:hypothetical protein MAR_022751 [Mya arenaria]|uniref:Uncharacterized protein n=1 Tax=Mya arenaria TaxID=6604 RepID=A0ABY7DNC4_MYAAR|nr:hypothetical protein MAR_022751 [Mya arenaria]
MAYIHFIQVSDVWALEKFKYPWPTPDMRIHKDYWPCGLEKNIKDIPVKHAVFVQCLNASFGGTAEAEWVMDMATRHPPVCEFVKIHSRKMTGVSLAYEKG